MNHVFFAYFERKGAVKPAAVVVNACHRRLKYWNETHGMMPKEQKEDREGMQTMGSLGRNMAWMIKCFKLGKEHGIEFPEPEPFT